MVQADHEAEKALAARHVAALVEPGMTIGLGTGTTARHAIAHLAERVRGGLTVRAVPSSIETQGLAERAGIPLTTLDEAPVLDLTIDGADEVDPQLNLIKGGGGALLREKVLASVSRRVAIMVDSRKIVPALGAFPLPVEVVPFACRPVADRIAALRGRPVLRRTADGTPSRTDQGHYVLDCAFPRIADPVVLAAQLDGIPGLVEHGLFIGLAHIVCVGRGDSVEWLRGGD